MSKQYDASRFTDRARKAMRLAIAQAKTLNHREVGVAHLLAALLEQERGVAADVLKRNGISDLASVVDIIRTETAPSEDRKQKQLPFTAELQEVIELARRERDPLGHNYVGTEHLLMGLCRLSHGPHIAIFEKFAVSPNYVRADTLHVLGHGPDPSTPIGIEIYLDPGDASQETVTEVLIALSELHVAAGGLGLEFVADDMRLQVLEGLPS